MENLSDVQFSDDQHFLLYFIMATYFGPDIKGCKPQQSASRLHAEVRPQYHINDLAGSCIKTMVIESVYYYILRKAEQSVIVKPALLLQYIRGTLPTPAEGSANYPKFDDIFPSHLHKHSQFDNQCHTIDNIVFIDNPEIGHVKPRDIERFKRLSGLEDFVLDKDKAMLHVFQDDEVLYSVKVQETSKLNDTMKHAENVQNVNCIPFTDAYPDGNDSLHSTMTSHSLPSQMAIRSEQDLDNGMIFLPSCPSSEEWSNLVATVKCGFALTGTAARGHVGPVLGLIDIGESEDSYLFRVSLPGVRRDERDFGCEVESDGTVIIKGVTVTGERVVEKYSQVFEMQSQNLCPPGPFSISFKLPGPVDPNQFHGTFATDGILEGIALKARI